MEQHNFENQVRLRSLGHLETQALFSTREPKYSHLTLPASMEAQPQEIKFLNAVPLLHIPLIYHGHALLKLDQIVGELVLILMPAASSYVLQ